MKAVVSVFCFSLIVNFRCFDCFKSGPIISSKLPNRSKASTSKLYLSDSLTSTVLAVGDFAAEIEGAVGSEIYAPIFRAGLFIVLSGFISAAIAGIIVNSADSWEELSMEFERGKEAQLTPVDTAEDIAKEAKIQENKDLTTDSTSDDVKYLDL
eukprot:CAMPEP_0182416798 /NCGR_PEP_ID=MMETSP1167-20130531/1157_1 /TAXON_ID=2988 /ORGANISM="Mallomonas Sp, Strain CCMP3275" /LENGTH=153 /DNA_ID=CAMNT_0024589875 /DNA_START=64 /DNA_END=525 /DNA_ORIENTATION=+